MAYRSHRAPCPSWFSLRTGLYTRPLQGVPLNRRYGDVGGLVNAVPQIRSMDVYDLDRHRARVNPLSTVPAYLYRHLAAGTSEHLGGDVAFALSTGKRVAEVSSRSIELRNVPALEFAHECIGFFCFGSTHLSKMRLPCQGQVLTCSISNQRNGRPRSTTRRDATLPTWSMEGSNPCTIAAFSLGCRSPTSPIPLTGRWHQIQYGAIGINDDDTLTATGNRSDRPRSSVGSCHCGESRSPGPLSSP